jgi:type IV secretory pathway TraG/TraD family ATPase VirD4
MRGWTIVVLVVLGAWIIIVGPPAIAEPFLRATPHFVFDLIEWLYFRVFAFPGRWVLLHIWSGFFSVPDPVTTWRVFVAVFAWVFAFVFSYFFWLILFSRFWKLTGRWNPFGWKTHRMRPMFLRAYANLGDWWETEFKFGRQVTGGFASLLGVLSNEFKHGDIFLGRPKLFFGGMLRPIGIPTEKHMVTIAGTGSGKSTGALVPNLCIHEGSLLCVDPKGELAAITARRRGNGGGGVRGMGQDVFVLNPFDLPILKGLGHASYNVYDEMERVAQYDADRPVSYASQIAQALIPPTTASRDPYWDNAARTFLNGLVLYVFQGPKEQRNLVRLRELLMEGDKESFQTLTKRGNDRRGDAFDALMTMMKNCPEGPYRHVIAGSAHSVEHMGGPQRGSVLTTAMEHTSFLDMPEIRRISMKSDFLLEDLKTRYISVYLCLPLNAVSGIEGHWLRMFVMLTGDMMMRASKAPNPPLLIAIDEFPSLGKLDTIESLAPTARSYGVRLWVVGQDLEQFERVYPDSWGSFISGAQAVQFMGIVHPPTVAWLAERLGQHVVVNYQRMGREVREIPSERALRDPDQIARMLSPAKKTQIIWRGNERPMLLKICPYFEYMPWWYYSRDPRFREKLNRSIWRGWQGDIAPPPEPPHSPGPPPKPPGRVLYPPTENKEEISSDSSDEVPDALNILPGGKPSLASYLPQEPGADVKPSDNVPGTKATWSEAITNFIQRTGEEAERAKQKKAEGHQETPGLEEGQPLVTPSGPLQKPPAKPPEKIQHESPPDPGVLPPLTPPKSPGGGKGPDAILGELDGMIGLAAVKAEVRKTINMVRLGRARDRKGMPHYDAPHHLVFRGNPGTGKTTVARIVGRIYKEMGVLKSGDMVEVDRGDMVAGYVGQTEPKTKEVIAKAMDGVLFIDEAYSLAPPEASPNDFGKLVISTLLKAMEDYRDRLVVIVAGYKEEMDHFINSNPGLKSRFKTYVDFEDYNSEELFRIFLHLGSEYGVRPSLDAQIAISNLMASLETGKKGFGNGRTVRNVFDECLARQGARLFEKGNRVDLTMFEKEDIPKVGEMVFF